MEKISMDLSRAVELMRKIRKLERELKPLKKNIKDYMSTNDMDNFEYHEYSAKLYSRKQYKWDEEKLSDELGMTRDALREDYRVAGFVDCLMLSR